MNIKANKELITSLLSRHPHLRDDDSKLLATVWKIILQYDGTDIKVISGYDLLKEMANGQLPSTESVTRCRRKLQEENISLRGELWKKRHQEQVNVKDQIIKWS